MNENDVRKWVDAATVAIHDVIRDVASKDQLRQIAHIMERLKMDLRNR